MRTKTETRRWRTPSALMLAVMLFLFAVAARTAIGQAKSSQQATRKVKVSEPPEYPELARRMKIQGMARVLLTVAPEGKVTGVKELGGNPVLVAALVDAVKKWKYEAADHESQIEVRFEFK